MRIKFIIGEAGTAKTTSLIKIANEVKTDFIATALTHSACNNLIEHGIPIDKVKTLHSYFRIMPDTTFINMPKHIPKFLIIDEFSLIPVNLLENIFKNFEQYETTIVLAGDLLQLPPVEENEHINIKNIKLNGSCSLEDAKKIFMTVGRTILNSPYYINSSKLLLTKNFRCEDNVMKILNNIIETDKIELTDINEVPSECVFIASTYKNLKAIRKVLKCNDIIKGTPVKTRVGNCDIDDRFILTKSFIYDKQNFYNGDFVKIISVNELRDEVDNCKIWKDNLTTTISKNEYGSFDLLPEQFLTIHYSQGRGFKNVCLCVDDLFEIPMLYTAITRAQKNIFFISLKASGILDVSDITRPFKIMRNNIYQG